jgi:hypothetical protein
MKSILLTATVIIASLSFSGITLAELGITDDCQEDIKELRDEIEENQDIYTMESRTKANAELTMASTNRLNPVKCRKNIQDARAALRKGKKGKREKE